MVWMVGGLLIVVIVVLLYSNIYIMCVYTYKQGKQMICARVFLYRIRLFKKDIDVSHIENSTMWTNIVKDKNILQILKHLQNTMQSLFSMAVELNRNIPIILKRMRIHKIEWNTLFGTGEAALTGLAAGGVWSAKGLLLGYLDSKSNIKCKPIVTVTPHFKYKYLDTKFDCIVSIKLGQAILGLIKVGKKAPLKRKAFIPQ